MDGGQKPVKTEAFFDIPFSPEEVWSVLSNTDWLNQSTGMPPVAYEVAPLAEGGTRVIAKMRMFGLPLQYEEKPFEWQEPDFYRVERLFPKGPLKQITVGMEFQSERREEGKTRLRFFSEFYPKGPFGRAMAQLVLKPLAVSAIGAVMQHLTEFLRGRKAVCLPKLITTEVNEVALVSAIRRLQENAEETQRNLISQLERFVRESPDVELARIRPFAMARRWNEDRWNVLRLFLLATRAGLLDLSWEVLCPNCRSTRQGITRQLSEMKAEAHCEVCQIRFDGEFDKSVELKFTVNSSIKSCEEKTFCLAGPGAKPHVIGQIVIGPKSSKTLNLPADRLGITIRSPQVREPLRGERLDGARRLVCQGEGFALEKGTRPDDAVEIFNPKDYGVVVLVEKSAWNEDILTAARATNLQDFRDLFSAQVVSPSEQIVVGQQIILFTDLRGSTAMYCGIGDAPAYSLVRDHFQILRDAVREHHGAIVKTIGDAVMGVFSDVIEALRAVWKMHLKLRESVSVDRPELKLKSSLHVGPCLAVNANERLDYFGTTVNLAARLVSCCQGGDLTMSENFYNRTETQEFLRGLGLYAESSEMRFRGFDSPMKVWRITI